MQVSQTNTLDTLLDFTEIIKWSYKHTTSVRNNHGLPLIDQAMSRLKGSVRPPFCSCFMHPGEIHTFVFACAKTLLQCLSPRLRDSARPHGDCEKAEHQVWQCLLLLIEWLGELHQQPHLAAVPWHIMLCVKHCFLISYQQLQQPGNAPGWAAEAWKYTVGKGTGHRHPRARLDCQ